MYLHVHTHYAGDADAGDLMHQSQWSLIVSLRVALVVAVAAVVLFCSIRLLCFACFSCSACCDLWVRERAMILQMLMRSLVSMMRLVASLKERKKNEKRKKWIEKFAIL